LWTINFKRENLSNLIPRNSGFDKMKTSATPLNRLNSRDMRLKEFRLKSQTRNRAKVNKNMKNKYFKTYTIRTQLEHLQSIIPNGGQNKQINEVLKANGQTKFREFMHSRSAQKLDNSSPSNPYNASK
jgi:hypothetical protein